MNFLLQRKFGLVAFVFFLFLAACGSEETKRVELVLPSVTENTWREFLTSVVGEEEAKRKAGDYYSRGYDFYRFREMWDHLSSIEYLTEEETPKTVSLYTPTMALEKCETSSQKGDDGHAFVVLHRWYLSQIGFLDPKPRDKRVTVDLLESAEKVSKQETRLDNTRELYERTVEKDSHAKVSDVEAVIYALLQLRTIYETSPSIDEFTQTLDYLLDLKDSSNENEYLPPTASPVVVSLLTDKVPLKKFPLIHEYLRVLTVRDSAQRLVTFDISVAGILAKDEKVTLEALKSGFEKWSNETNEAGAFTYSHAEALVKTVKDLGIGKDIRPFLAD